jgi:hypothetical protein
MADPLATLNKTNLRLLARVGALEKQVEALRKGLTRLRRLETSPETPEAPPPRRTKPPGSNHNRLAPVSGWSIDPDWDRLG